MNFALKFHRASALGGKAQSLQPSRHLQRFLRKKIGFRIGERRNVYWSYKLKCHFARITGEHNHKTIQFVCKGSGRRLPETRAPRHRCAQVPYTWHQDFSITVHVALTKAKAAVHNYWAAVPFLIMSLRSHIHRIPRHDSATPAPRGVTFHCCC
jgi:hypothetical protein